jgi:hypothetical protein
MGIRTLSLVLIPVIAACGDNRGAAPDASPPMPDAPPAFAEAPHPDAPQVMSGGGPVLVAPKVVPIFFANDSAVQPTIESFLHALAGSSYWTTTTGEYGVGALTIANSIVTSDPPPTTDDALATWLQGKFPSPDPSTIYTVFLPAGAVLTLGGERSCTTFGGYHSETMVGSAPLVYALLPRCTSTTFSGALDSTTIATSHELVEASTDPLPFSNPAFTVVDDAHAVWRRIPGGELGDMCEYVRTAFQPLVGSFMVQRTWSNASAAAGHDPCVPVLATPYLGAAPELPDLTLSFHGQQLMTKGVTVNYQQSQTVDVDLYTDAPTEDYVVIAEDAAQVEGGSGSFSFEWDRSTGHNGDKLHLMITRTKMGTGRPSEVGIFVQVNNQTVSTSWSYVAGQ